MTGRLRVTTIRLASRVKRDELEGSMRTSRTTFGLLMALPAALLGAGCTTSPPEQAALREPPAKLNLSPERRARCLEVLRDGMTAKPFWPAMHAAEALTEAGCAEEVRESLQKRLDGEREIVKRVGLARELVRAGDRSKLAVLRKVLLRPYSRAQMAAVESLFYIGEVGDLQLLQGALSRRRRPRLQVVAAAALAQGGHRQGMDALRRALTGRESRCRGWAAWGLGRVGAPADLERLRQLATHERNPYVQCRLAGALARHGNADALRTLGAFLESGKPSLVANALVFLREARTPAFRGRVAALLDSSFPDVRIRAAHALLALSGP